MKATELQDEAMAMIVGGSSNDNSLSELVCEQMKTLCEAMSAGMKMGSEDINALRGYVRTNDAKQ